MQLNGETIKAALDRMEQETPENRWLFVKSLLINLAERTTKAEARTEALKNAILPLVKAMRAAGGRRGPAAGSDAAMPQIEGQPGVRMGADGQPITDPSQLAAEEAMDAAIGSDGDAAPMPMRRRNGNGSHAPAPVMGEDAAQAAAEAAMNEAAGPRAE